MEFYKTNSGLGYNQYAILLKCGDGFVCIDTENLGGDNDNYKIGKFIICDQYTFVEKIEYNLENSPLHNDFIFNFFIENYGKLRK